MTQWHDVGAPDDFPDGGCWPVRVGDHDVAVFRLGDALHALQDQCSHGAARLSEGYVEDGCVECPLHQGRIDIRTGAPCGFPVTVAVKAFPVRVIAGRVQVADAAAPVGGPA